MIGQFAINGYLNSVLIFATSVLLVQIILWVVRPRSPRLRLFCLLLPVLKLPIDLCRYHVGSWAWLWGISPAETGEGTRILTAEAGINRFFLPDVHLDLMLTSGQTFTLVDLLTGHWTTWALWFVLTLLFVGSLVGLGLVIWKIQRERKIVQSVCKRATPFAHRVWVSAEAERPFAALGKVVLPTELVERLSKKELDAVIAHEKAHLRWHDGFLGALVSGIGNFFWCIPGMGSWKRSISHEMERSCDEAASQPLELASALCKAARLLPEKAVLQPATALFRRRSGMVRRVRALLRKGKGRPRALEFALGGLAIYLCIGVLFGRLWLV